MKKNIVKQTAATLLAKKIIVVSMVLVALNSCKKEKFVAPAVVHNYEGQWKNQVPDPTKGPLDFFNLKTSLVNGGTGILDASYIQPFSQYPLTNLAWQKISGDSVVITLDMTPYPSEKWELRGIADDANKTITADYFSIPNNNPAGKHKYGTMVLTKI